MGHAHLLNVAGEWSFDGCYWNNSWSYLLLLGVCLSCSCRDSRVEKKENIRAAEDTALDLWNVSRSRSTPRLITDFHQQIQHTV
mmetsp:Transcript_13080/g.21442  ORF Transcript_13080/g.21442 Transcript_13080/m.21442 type:complete len:84 (+) Transcript_13080:682-933(+)